MNTGAFDLQEIKRVGQSFLYFDFLIFNRSKCQYHLFVFGIMQYNLLCVTINCVRSILKDIGCIYCIPFDLFIVFFFILKGTDLYTLKNYNSYQVIYDTNFILKRKTTIDSYQKRREIIFSDSIKVVSSEKCQTSRGKDSKILNFVTECSQDFA